MNRRDFLAMSQALLPLAAQQRPFDLVIQNGELRDPLHSLRRKADLAIRDGRIAAVEEHIAADRAIETIDAKGLYVTPGLIDLHTHCYHDATQLGVEADPIAARSGVSRRSPSQRAGVLGPEFRSGPHRTWPAAPP